MYVTSVTCTHSLSCDYVLSHLTIVSYIPVYTQKCKLTHWDSVFLYVASMSWSIFERLISTCSIYNMKKNLPFFPLRNTTRNISLSFIYDMTSKWRNPFFITLKCIFFWIDLYFASRPCVVSHLTFPRKGTNSWKS